MACFFCPTFARQGGRSGHFPVCVRCAKGAVARVTHCPKAHELAGMKQIAGARRIPSNYYRHILSLPEEDKRADAAAG